MCKRLWGKFLLIAWIGSWALAPLSVTGIQMWSVWCAPDYLAERVGYQIQVQQRLLWPPRRTKIRCRPRCRRTVWRAPGQQTETDGAQSAGTLSEERAPADRATSNRPEEQTPVDQPQRWGLTSELSLELPERLQSFCQRYHECFKTKTRNVGEYAYHYLSALLRMETKRNYVNIGQTAGVPGENIQHFMSNSPWATQVALEQVREEIKATPGLQRGGMLLLDESADEAAGDKKAGVGRQYNGRLGKVDLSQVGVFLAYANLTDVRRPVWNWVDGELFLPEHWFSPEMAEMRQRVGLPSERQFETKTCAELVEVSNWA